MDFDIEEDSSKKKKPERKLCIFCKRLRRNTQNFSSCIHNICSTCLYERIFVNHIHEFQGQNKIRIKCSCEKGFIEQTLTEIIELLEKKSQSNSFASQNNYEEIKNCELHPDTLSTNFCLDCLHYLCEKCFSENNYEHKDHRVLSLDKLINFIISNINKISLKNGGLDDFQKKCENIEKKFQEEVEKNFNKTIKHIDGLIKSIMDFRDSYIQQYKGQLKNYIQVFKIIKLFYMNYYKDRHYLQKISGEENNNYQNIFTLRYLNNISYELKDVEIKHSQEIDKRCDEFKKLIEILKGPKVKYIRGNFLFENVNKSYYIDEVVNKTHEKFISSMIPLKDNKIITGGNDYTMRIWSEDEKEKGYKTIQIIKTGKILCILSLRNGKLLSSSQNNNNILVWEDKGEEEGYQNTQSLTSHDECIISMAELTDGKIISGSADCKVFIWEEEAEQYVVKQRIYSEKSPIYIVAALYDCKLAFSSDNGIINVWAANTEMKENRIISKDFGFIQPLIGHKGKVSCICQLNNGYLATGGMDFKGKIDHKIIIWKQVGKGYKISQELLGHEADVNSIIELRDGKIASSSKDRTIKIWKMRKNTDNRIVYSLCEKLAHYGHGLYKMIQLNDDRLCTTASDDKIVFWRNRVCIL